jgi:eukaryotic-like serine/threonine-protein kinase
MTEDRFGIVGKVIARTYEIKDVVAEGGFGVVYRAYHQGFRAEVALKCLKIPSELSAAQRQSFLEQFRSEAEVLFRLSAHNTHIVRPLHVDAFQTKEGVLVPFMALEWLEGRTLDGLMFQRAELGKPPISLTKLVRLLTPVAGALEQAHNLPGKDGPQTVIHRDMKPENLFIARIGRDDVAKVLDFGISKVKSTAGQMAGRASMKADALVAFSPAYGAPEQWAPKRFGQTGRWTDVWGLALTVVEVAKGEEVVGGDHAEMMGTILDPGRRPTPRTEGIQVTDQVERIFAKALAVDPVNRYQSVGAFWDDLTSALGIQNEVGAVSIHRAQARSSGRATTGIDSVAPSPGIADLDVMPPARAPLASVHEAPTGFSPLNLGGMDGVGIGAPTSRPAVSQPLSSQPLSSQQSFASRPVVGGYQSPGSGSGPVLSAGYRSQQSSKPGSIPSPYSYEPERPSLLRALGPSLALIGLSVAFTILDRAFAHSRGVPLVFGGVVQASWIAGGLMVIALVTGAIALKRALED